MDLLAGVAIGLFAGLLFAAFNGQAEWEKGYRAGQIREARAARTLRGSR